MSNNEKLPCIEEACKQLEGLDIYGNERNAATFIRVAIEYTRQEYAHEGIDLLSETSQSDVQEFSNLWLKESGKTENDLALIALNHAIKYHVNKVMAERMRKSSP